MPRLLPGRKTAVILFVPHIPAIAQNQRRTALEDEDVLLDPDSNLRAAAVASEPPEGG